MSAIPRRLSTRFLILATALACVGGGGGSCDEEDDEAPGAAAVDPDAKVAPPKAEPPAPSPDGKKPIVPALKADAAPEPSPRLAAPSQLERFTSAAGSYFEGSRGRRLHVQVDKPLYKPGETVWIRSYDLAARDLSGAAGGAIQYELVSPKGAVVLRKRLQETAGFATNDFEIPEGAQGGEYLIRARASDGTVAERPVIVSTYEAPRLQKKLEFLRKAYGPGDLVQATVELKRATGEPLADHPVSGAVRLDDQDLPRVQARTDASGAALLKFTLPSQLELGDGILTVLVEDGGITESVSKRVPIVLRKLSVGFFPEGGQLVAGLPGRVYFSAKNTLGKPADVSGTIVDELGNAVARFESVRDGLGRVAFTPATGRTYSAKIEKPEGISEQYQLPLAADEGCVLSSYDDLDGELPPLRVGVRCSKARQVIVASVLRDRLLDAAALQVTAGGLSVAYLSPKDESLSRAQGVARVTLFDEALEPIAERLVFRNRRARLGVSVTPERKSYGPRDQVTLQVTTTDPTGEPVPASLALSVVDDTVLSFADDKQGHLLSRLLLEPELPGKVEEPNFYLDLTEAKSAAALDMLLGTSGYRRFEWRRVLSPPQPVSSSGLDAMIGGTGTAAPEEAELDRKGGALERRRDAAMLPPADGRAKKPAPMAMPKKQAAPASPPAVAVVEPQAMAAAPPPPPPAPAQEPAAMDRRARPQAPMAGKAARREILADDLMNGDLDLGVIGPRGGGGVGVGGLAGDREFAGALAAEKKKENAPAFASVRVFPAPAYTGPFTGRRTDFRETIHWAPDVRTGKDGKATVSFYLSDAVTSFRVVTEGVAAGAPRYLAGLAGRDESTVRSSLPFSMTVKLPQEVSAGDRLLLPLTLASERSEELPVVIHADFGPLLGSKDGADRTERLGPGGRKSLMYALHVTGQSGTSKVAFAASAGGLSDEFSRELTVVPAGFPQQLSRSGTAKGRVVEELTLPGAEAGTIEASVRFYPSPLATLTAGLEGMLREPSGCFEQASSSNYPNVMVMQYMQSSGQVDPALVEKSQKLLDSGYRKLTGYEAKDQGYEWFGGSPGHEALTAYGVLEFTDMRGVFPVDDAMIVRTASWLRSKRDGKGGYQRNARALDSFGAASPEVTDAYITYSLVEAGQKELGAELDAQAKLAASTGDGYLLALSSNTLLAAKRPEGQQAVARLAKLQEADGGFKNANHSITRSGGVNLQIETTSLAAMALIRAGGHDAEVRQAIEWLQKNRSGQGQWGATQATVLALKAMVRYAEATRKTQAGGSVTILVNGQVAGEKGYQAGHKDAIVFADLGRFFRPGANKVELIAEGKDALPFSLAAGWRTRTPASGEKAVVELTTSLSRSELKLGETVRATAVVKNRTDRGQPMTLARVGIPGGLSFQPWQLKELKEKGEIAFWETRAREVILYFRDLKPGEIKTVPVELVATVPGEYEGPASSTYLYYTDDQKSWSAPLKVSILP